MKQILFSFILFASLLLILIALTSHLSLAIDSVEKRRAPSRELRFMKTRLARLSSGSGSERLKPKTQRAMLRFRRDFMYVASSSETLILDDAQLAHNTTHVIDDVKCFKKCNNAWRDAFERRFEMRVADFYDFPFHPKILDYSNFAAYCALAEQQNRCFIEQCNDPSADRIFSPSNFLCSFKRNQFVRTRPCFEETEPLTFLKCDQRCHKSASSALLRRTARAADKQQNATTTTTLTSTTLGTTTTVTTTTTTTKATTTPVEASSTSPANLRINSTTNEATTTTTNVNLISPSTTESVRRASELATSVSSTTIAETSATSSTPAIFVEENTLPVFDSRDAMNTLLKNQDNPEFQQNRAEAGKVFIKSEMDSYEHELDLLCTFQECYKQCHESILREICAPGLADNAIDLIASFINWHAADVHDWHVITQNTERLPKSCSRLADSALTASTPIGSEPDATTTPIASMLLEN